MDRRSTNLASSTASYPNNVAVLETSSANLLVDLLSCGGMAPLARQARQYNNFLFNLSCAAGVNCATARRGGWLLGDGSGGSGMEWITVDQLDHALRTCHLTRRALDPQVIGRTNPA